MLEVRGGVGKAGGIGLGQGCEGPWIMGEPFRNYEGSSTILNFRKIPWFWGWIVEQGRCEREDCRQRDKGGNPCK